MFESLGSPAGGLDLSWQMSQEPESSSSAWPAWRIQPTYRTGVGLGRARAARSVWWAGHDRRYLGRTTGAMSTDPMLLRTTTFTHDHRSRCMRVSQAETMVRLQPAGIARPGVRASCPATGGARVGRPHATKCHGSEPRVGARDAVCNWYCLGPLASITATKESSYWRPLERRRRAT